MTMSELATQKTESLRLRISCHNTESTRFNIKITSGQEMASHAEIMKAIWKCYARLATSRPHEFGERSEAERRSRYAGIVYSGPFSLDVNFNTCVRVRFPFPSPATASSFAAILPAIHGPSKLCAVSHYAFFMATI